MPDPVIPDSRCCWRAAGLRPSWPTKRAEPLVGAGLDSLSSMELRDAVSQEFDLELPSTLVFDHPTINAIAELVMSRSSRAGDPAGSVDPADPAGGDVLRLRPRQGDNDNDGGLAVAIASVSASYPMSRGLDQLLTGCQDVQRAVPLERWDVEAHYSVGADGMYARFGAFFEDITMFDVSMR